MKGVAWVPRLCGPLLGAWLLAACASLQPGFTPDPWEKNGDLLSTNALLVADNQQNHLFGEGVWIRSDLTDRLVRPAIRSTPLELFGGDVLRWILSDSFRAGLVIHVGDALNISCLAEWEVFQETMATWRLPWFLVPGNHDGYYFGNGHFARGEWERACSRPDHEGIGEVLTKDRVIAHYLDALAAQDDPGARAFRDEAQRADPAGEWRYEGEDLARLRAVAWKRDMDRPWRSYLVQEVDLRSAHGERRVLALLVDTSQYRLRPRLAPLPPWRNAGITGSIERDQLAVLRRWTAGAAEESAVLLLVGHHPFARIELSSRRPLRRLFGGSDVRLFVSAHTHDGEFISHDASSRQPSFLELNVGSTTDWPMELRTLRLTSLDDGVDGIQLRTFLYPLGEVWEEAGGFDPGAPECLPEWIQGPEFYISHVRRIDPSPGKTQGKLMDAVLRTIDLAISVAPTDTTVSAPWPEGTETDAEVRERIEELLRAGELEEKIDFASQLAAFDRGRTAEEPDLHRDWRLCQAMWASRDDETEARLPRRRDAFVSFPKE